MLPSRSYRFVPYCEHDQQMMRTVTNLTEMVKFLCAELDNKVGSKALTKELPVLETAVLKNDMTLMVEKLKAELDCFKTESLRKHSELKKENDLLKNEHEQQCLQADVLKTEFDELKTEFNDFKIEARWKYSELRKSKELLKSLYQQQCLKYSQEHFYLKTQLLQQNHKVDVLNNTLRKLKTEIDDFKREEVKKDLELKEADDMWKTKNEQQWGKVDVLTTAVRSLTTELDTFKKEAVEKFTEYSNENAQLKYQLEQHSQMCNGQVKQLEARLEEFEPPQPARDPRIRRAVCNFNDNYNWEALLEELQPALEQDTLLYKQAKAVDKAYALGHICEQGFAELLAVLLDAGLDVNKKHFNTGATLMHVVAESGQVRLAEVLLGRGAKLKMRNNDGDTALIEAVRGKQLQMVKWLVYHGENVNSRVRGGRTCLHEAAQVNCLSVARYLVQAGADTTVRSSGGVTPLDIARRYGSRDVINYLSGFQR